MKQLNENCNYDTIILCAVISYANDEHRFWYKVVSQSLNPPFDVTFYYSILQ